MEHRDADIQYCERLFQRFYEIGSTPQGGVTRLGYSETEDAMHEAFKECSCAVKKQKQTDSNHCYSEARGTW